MDRRNFLKLLGAAGATMFTKFMPGGVPEKPEETATDLLASQESIDGTVRDTSSDYRARGYLDIGGRQILIKKWSVEGWGGTREWSANGGYSQHVATVKGWSGTAALFFDDPLFLLDRFRGQLFVWCGNEEAFSGKVIVAGAGIFQGKDTLQLKFVGCGPLIARRVDEREALGYM